MFFKSDHWQVRAMKLHVSLQTCFESGPWILMRPWSLLTPSSPCRKFLRNALLEFERGVQGKNPFVSASSTHRSSWHIVSTEIVSNGGSVNKWKDGMNNSFVYKQLPKQCPSVLELAWQMLRISRPRKSSLELTKSILLLIQRHF